MNYNEDEILQEVFAYVKSTYGEHYAGDKNIQLFDYWQSRGTLSTIAIGTAEKYLSRFGLKEGKNKKDLLKAMHYIILAMYANFYADADENSAVDPSDPDVPGLEGINIQDIINTIIAQQNGLTPETKTPATVV